MAAISTSPTTSMVPPSSEVPYTKYAPCYIKFSEDVLHNIETGQVNIINTVHLVELTYTEARLRFEELAKDGLISCTTYSNGKIKAASFHPKIVEKMRATKTFNLVFESSPEAKLIFLGKDCQFQAMTLESYERMLTTFRKLEKPDDMIPVIRQEEKKG